MTKSICDDSGAGPHNSKEGLISKAKHDTIANPNEAAGNDNLGKDNGPLMLKIGNKWLNLDIWKRTHPGGAACLQRFQGQDATEAFQSIHSKEAVQMIDKMKNVEASISDKISRGYINPTKTNLAFRQFRAQLEKDGWFNRNWFMDSVFVGFCCFPCLTIFFCFLF